MPYNWPGPISFEEVESERGRDGAGRGALVIRSTGEGQGALAATHKPPEGCGGFPGWSSQGTTPPDEVAASCRHPRTRPLSKFFASRGKGRREEPEGGGAVDRARALPGH
jgi:hypothetical protein